MRYTRAIGSIVLLAATLGACRGDDDDDGASSCSPDLCYGLCHEDYAEDLETCNDICGIEAYCTTDDVCKCHFYPCYNEACLAWCQENTELDGGACDPLNCECF